MLKSLPHHKISTLVNLQTFPDQFSVAQMVQFFFNKVVNIVEKGENAGNQHFLLFQQYFQTFFLLSQHYAVKGKSSFQWYSFPYYYMITRSIINFLAYEKTSSTSKWDFRA